MFILSHLCGPFIGLALSAFLLLLGFPADGRLSGFTMLVCLFWAYPAALRLGVNYAVLSLVSIQHLILVVLWASHGYGGLTSPFLLWLAIVPLLAFLYSQPRVRLWMILLVMLALNVGLFAAVTHFLLPSPPADPDALGWLAAISLFAAWTYVAMMAVYFSRVLSSRNEMAQTVARRRASLTGLDQQATQLRQMRASKLASLARLASRCREPVNEMRSLSCEGRLNANAAPSLGRSDMLCIHDAATRLSAILASIDAFAADLPRANDPASNGTLSPTSAS